MPTGTESSAPQFDPAKPRGIPRFFKELEFLFSAAHITDDQEKKMHAQRYVPCDDDYELWESLPEYQLATVTYEQFKAEILLLYPEASDEYRYSRTNVEGLVRERRRLGISSLEDLMSYYRGFIPTTVYLIKKGRMSKYEQSRLFLKGFQPELAGRVFQRLQLRHPDIEGDDLYTLGQILAAARYVLQWATTGFFASTLTPPSPGPVSSPTESPATVFAKQEDLCTFLNKFAQIVDTVTANPAIATRAPQQQQQQQQRPLTKHA
ncbi:hypothetical protein APHAL10511_003940 [Amanita phalloides]|nr:hypothetical protein APHAL10511_003940 [Amanita phalloides]